MAEINIRNFGQLSLSIHRPPIYKIILYNDIMATHKIEEITDYNIKKYYTNGRIYLEIDDIRVQVGAYENMHIHYNLGEAIYYAINKDALIKEITYKLTNRRKELKDSVREEQKRIKNINHTLKLLEY